MTYVDLAFSIHSQKPIPVDHGYALYGALSRLVPEVHRENGIAIHPIRGRQVGDRMVMLMPWSTLTLRVPDGQIAPLLKFSGKAISLGDTPLRIGVPEVRSLEPASILRSRLVVIKVAHITPASTVSEEQFLTALKRQLAELGISDQVLPTLGKRRTLRLKQNEIVGYEVLLEGLSAEESITLQEQCLGGRNHMGCGVFLPVRT